MLKKDVKFVWDENYQKTFEDIKQYLLNPPILVPMDFSKPTYLYISATLYALGTMLGQKDTKNKERAIYYLSKTLIDYETRYASMEKICYGIIFTNEKLRHYLLYCTTFFVSLVNPLKYLMAKHHLSGTLAKWLMLLQEFDINVVK